MHCVGMFFFFQISIISFLIMIHFFKAVLSSAQFPLFGLSDGGK